MSSEVHEPDAAIANDATIAQRTREIRADFRRILPKQAFQPRPQTLWYAAAQWAQILTGIAIIAWTDVTWIKVGASVFTGHAVFCMTIVAHSVSHGSVVRKLRLRYPLEILLWTPTFISTTAWIVLHHKFHHNHTNTTRDVYLYRYFTHSERRIGARTYGLGAALTLTGNPQRFRSRVVPDGRFHDTRRRALLGTGDAWGASGSEPCEIAAEAASM